MVFTIVARTLFKSAGCLNPDQLQRVQDFVGRFQANPDAPGFGFEPVDGAAGPGCWLARLGADAFAVLHHQGDRHTLLFVGSREDAERWCREHRVEPHPVTGTVQVVPVPTENGTSATTAADPLYERFGQFTDDFLMRLGVPADWTERVRAIHDERSFWNVYERMPPEAAERLYSLALGEEVEIVERSVRVADPQRPPQEHADNLRWMYVIDGNHQLSEVLSRPFEDWMLFLHPSQRSLVTKDFNGPSKVTGSAGTGKTVVALHRARHLARLGKRVLLTTYTNRLVENLKDRIRRLCYAEETQRITIATTHSVARDLAHQIDPRLHLQFFRGSVAKAELARGVTVNRNSLQFIGTRRADVLKFVEDEWNEVIDRHGILTWEEYRDVTRAGRGTGLAEDRRERLWKVFGPAAARVQSSKWLPPGILCRVVREAMEAGKIPSPYDSVIVDEVQDLNPQELRLLTALCSAEPEYMTIIGDAGQRIYPGGFSLRQLGINVAGRSHTLTINYRTTHEIARAASALRSDEKLDEETEGADGAHDLLRGAKPVLAGFPPGNEGFRAYNQFLVSQIQKLRRDGVALSEIGMFARTGAELAGIRGMLTESGINAVNAPDDGSGAFGDAVYLSTLHGAKGLEFRHVFVMNCSSSKLPLKSLVKGITDEAEKEAVLRLERNLLYVAMTRARDRAWLTWAGNRSPFLDAIEQHAEIYSGA